MTAHVVCRDCPFEAAEDVDEHARETAAVHELFTGHQVAWSRIDDDEPTRMATDGGLRRPADPDDSVTIELSPTELRALELQLCGKLAEFDVDNVDGGHYEQTLREIYSRLQLARVALPDEESDTKWRVTD